MGTELNKLIKKEFNQLDSTQMKAIVNELINRLLIEHKKMIKVKFTE